MKSIRWATPDCPLDGKPDAIQRLLASSEGKTFGYGYGPGWSMMFGTERGDIVVQPGQWVTRHDGGAITVSDEPPLNRTAKGMEEDVRVDSRCRHCGQPIKPDGRFWLHRVVGDYDHWAEPEEGDENR